MLEECLCAEDKALTPCLLDTPFPPHTLNKYKQSKQNRRKRSFRWILQACRPFSRWSTCGSDGPARAADSSFSLVAQDRDLGCGVETRPLSSALGGGVTHPPPGSACSLKVQLACQFWAGSSSEVLSWSPVAPHRPSAGAAGVPVQALSRPGCLRSLSMSGSNTSFTHAWTIAEAQRSCLAHASCGRCLPKCLFRDYPFCPRLLLQENCFLGSEDTGGRRGSQAAALGRQPGDGVLRANWRTLLESQGSSPLQPAM